METFNRVAALLLAILCLSGTVCLADESAVFTVTDQAGREVTFSQPAQSIVSCYYISTASLVALGLEEQLVGIEMKSETRRLYQMAAPQLIDLPAVGSGKGINIEEIAALAPDVVILPMKLAEEAEMLEALDIPVVIVNPETQDAFEECVILLGQVTGTQEKATALIERFHAMSEDVRLMTAVKSTLPTVYMASGSDFLTTFPNGFYQNDLIHIAGGINVASGLTGDRKAVIDAEQLTEWNPDYIFIVADADYTPEDIAADERFCALKAVTDDHIYTFPSDIEAWDYPTPSSVLGQSYMASVLHPDLIDAETFIGEAKALYKDVFDIDITEDDLGLK